MRSAGDYVGAGKSAAAAAAAAASRSSSSIAYRYVSSENQAGTRPPPRGQTKYRSQQVSITRRYSHSFRNR